MNMLNLTPVQWKTSRRSWRDKLTEIVAGVNNSRRIAVDMIKFVFAFFWKYDWTDR